MNYLGEIIHRYSPTFAALASLREIFRVSVAALPRWDYRPFIMQLRAECKRFRCLFLKDGLKLTSE